METLEAIRTRRSVRRYTSRDIPDELRKRFLRAAMAAPSAGNEQPWHFIVIRDHALLHQIPSVHPYSHMVPQAPLAILICGDLDRAAHGEMWVQDCAAATENLLLAAHALGLGAVWLGVYPREERIRGLRSLLAIPERIVPFALVPVGYAAETVAPEDRYDESRIHYERW